MIANKLYRVRSKSAAGVIKVDAPAAAVAATVYKIVAPKMILGPVEGVPTSFGSISLDQGAFLGTSLTVTPKKDNFPMGAKHSVTANQRAVAALHPSRRLKIAGQTFALAIPTDEAEEAVMEALSAVRKLEEPAEGEERSIGDLMILRRYSQALLAAVLPDVDEESLRALVRADVDLEPLYDRAKRLVGLRPVPDDEDGGGEEPANPS